MGASPLNAKRLSSSSATVPSLSGRPSGVSSGSSTITPTKGVEDMKLSLVEKLKQRMRQGLESGTSCHATIVFLNMCACFLNWMAPHPVYPWRQLCPGFTIFFLSLRDSFVCVLCVCVWAVYCLSLCKQRGREAQ